ncbi:MAG: right-handed parallel beta-helix repeat-containing protein [Myxococcales bacterium]|nr:right-handed parallel beta-helix repeat-containing protein [Myxococcales bacterium]
MRTWFVMLILAGLIGCDDEPAGTVDDATPLLPADAAIDGADTGGVDAATQDGGARDGGGDDAALDDAGADLDATADDAAAIDAGDDAAPDAEPDAEPDATLEPDAAPREAAPAMALSLDDAVVDGSATRLDRGLLLDPGARVSWTIADPGALAVAPAVQLAVAAEIWRVEDGAFTVEWNGSARPVEVRGDADGGAAIATLPYADWTAPVFGPAAGPPAVDLPTAPGAWTLTLTATGGSVELRELWLVDPLGPLPEAAPRPAPPAPVTVLEPLPCEPPAGGTCDDAALLTAAIQAAPPGPLTVRLAPATYTLRTPLRVARDDVRLEGAGDTTVLFWDPAGGGGPAIRFGGAGLVNAEAAAVVGPLDGASRFYRVEVPAEWAPERLWVTADDFGDIPPVCLNGRDVERYQRHIGRMVRVLGIERDPEGPGAVVEVDRPLNLDVPPEANPRLVPVRATRGGGVFALHLEANCPEAGAVANFTQAACTNAAVIGHNGLFFEWADGAVGEAVSSRAFGKFSVVVQHSVDVRLYGCSMDHPAAYGDGGEGYGVHLIFTGRTLVRDERVEVARHGVVVDFGSTDAQVIDGFFRTMSQALVDVHGEASYDTLVRGCDMAGSTLGVIVGGGGREVHCNDGPRHHVEHNTIAEAGLAAVSISDYTQGVYVRGNVLTTSATGVTAAFGAREILVEHNVFGPVTLGLTPVMTINADTGALTARRNLFEVACSPQAAGSGLLFAEAPLLEDNVYCPQ